MPNESRARSTLVHKAPNALRYGVYSRTAVLPGEDQAEFDRLHRDLIAEFCPEGPIECEIIQSMARHTWRKQNLVTIRKATLVQRRLLNVIDEIVAARFPAQAAIMPHPQSPEIMELAKAQICKEFDDVSALLEVGEAAGFASLGEVLDLEERLDGMIDKCLRRLLLVRGMKSLPGVDKLERVQRIAGPTAEA